MKILCTPFLLLLTTITLAQNFTGSFDLVMTQESASGNMRQDTIAYYFAETKTAIIIRAKGNQPDLRLVFVPADSTITGLFEMNEKKGGYILPMNDKYWPGMQYALRDFGTGPRMNLNDTESKETINGILCHEMKCESEKYDVSLYIAPEIELSLVQVLAYQSVGAGEDTEAVDMLNACGVQGFAMRSIVSDKKRDATITLAIQNMSSEVPERIFSTEGYSISDMRKNN